MSSYWYHNKKFAGIGRNIFLFTCNTKISVLLQGVSVTAGSVKNLLMNL